MLNGSLHSALMALSRHNPKNLRFVLADALRNVFDQSTFPAIKRLEIFNIRSCTTNRDARFSRQDILANETVIYLLHFFSSKDENSSSNPGGSSPTLQNTKK